MKPSFFFFIPVVLGLAALHASAQTGDAFPALYTAAEPGARQVIAMPFATKRAETVQFDPAVIRDLPPEGPHHFFVPGFGEDGFNIVLYGRETWGESSVIWKLEVLGQNASHGSVVYHQGNVLVRIERPGETPYYLQPAAASQPGDESATTYLFRQIDESVTQTCACGEDHEPAAPPPSLRAPDPETSSGAQIQTSSTVTYIDVAVVYSTTASIYSGGPSIIESIILDRHFAANTAHDDSDTKTRLRLVHLGPIDYIETGDINDVLLWLELSPTAQSIQTGSGADLVHMFVSAIGSPGVNGLAHDPGSHGVSKWNSISAYTYAHEIGHNIGCQHEVDHNEAPTTGYGRPYEITETWTVLFDDFTQTQNTIMWSSASATSRIPMFSNPNRTWVMDGGSCSGFGEAACSDVTRVAGNASSADMARFIREERSNSADNNEPKLYLDSSVPSLPFYKGDATTRNPSKHLFEVTQTNGWLDETEADPTKSTEVLLRAGTYNVGTVINHPITLKKWEGSGNVVIAP